MLSRISSALTLLEIFTFLSFHFCKLALKGISLSLNKIASTFQYSLGSKLRISSSRSQMMRKATDCTRPALRFLVIIFQRSGLIL